MGKTSMIMSLATHQFGRENAIIIDAMGEGAGTDQSLADFKQHFGVYSIASFIAERESPDAASDDKYDKENAIMEQMVKSGQSPFAFLNAYLAHNGEKIFVSLDEVVGLADQTEQLTYLAVLKNLSQIRLAIVLHRVAAYEEAFEKIFEGYETYFIRPLTLEEVGVLVRKPLEGTRITFTDDAIQKIFAWTGGRPMEVNHVCIALMDQFSQHKKYKLRYGAEDIDRLTEKDTWQLGNAFRVITDNYKRIYARSMSDEERLIVSRLVQESRVAVSDIDAKRIQPLIDTTFVAKDEEKGMYFINGDFFKRIISDRNV